MGVDKGKCTVVQSTTEYERKVEEMLSDQHTNEKLTKNPTPTYKRKLVDILKRLKSGKKIDEAQYRLLYPTAENTPRMYCTTKIHKAGNPISPIVDYTCSIGYQTSKALAEILAPLVGKSEHHIVKSKHLADEMGTVIVDEGDIFNSHDAVSLFTNTPIEKCLDIIKDRLINDSILKDRTRLVPDDIIELLKFVLTTTYFSFRGNLYRQIFGAAMGSPVSSIVANLFMEWLEKEAIATAPLDLKPKLWRRYVKDMLEIIKKGTTENLTEHLNKVDPTGSIKFTFEEEDQGKIPFLDTLLVRKEDGSVKLLVYRKKTHTEQYLDFKSQYPLHHKLGVIRTLMDGMENIVTEEQNKKEEEQTIRTALTHCGYQKWALDRVKQRIVNKPQKPRKSKPNKDAKDTTRGTVVVPYVESLTEKLQRIYRKHRIHAAVSPSILQKVFLSIQRTRKTLQRLVTLFMMYPVAGVTSHKWVRRADNLAHGWKNTRNMWQRLPMLNSQEQIGKRPPQSSTNLPLQTTWPKKTTS